MPDSLETVAVPSSTRGKVVEAVVRLGRAAHKSTIYPPGHPAVPAAVKFFVEALAQALEQKPVLSLGVARDRVLVEGEAIVGKNHVLTWLAERLHERGIAALEISGDIPESDGVRFVEWLAASEAIQGTALPVPEFQGIQLTRFDALVPAPRSRTPSRSPGDRSGS